MGQSIPAETQEDRTEEGDKVGELFGQEGSHYPLLRQTQGLAKAGAFWCTVTTQDDRYWQQQVLRLLIRVFWGLNQ